jgi:glycosyltransferase involved in cell wall biosynthesis
MRIAMVLPGLGRVQRGAETAFLEIARSLHSRPDISVQLFGSGRAGVGEIPIHVIPCLPREKFERWPTFPAFRSDCHYEEFSFARNLARSGLYKPQDFDIVIGCTYPHVNWFLRYAGRRSGPKIVYVTQNGDCPCRSRSREFRYFRSDGLVCTNPEYWRAHQNNYDSCLIPNGVDPNLFRPSRGNEPRSELLRDIPPGRVILMASALVESKRVAEGIEAVARVPDAFLVVIGDGPMRSAIAKIAETHLPGRHRLLGSVPRELMPELFRGADVFLHMSRDEPFGIVYLEAAATALPIVAHDSEIPRWILEDTALFADTADLPAVADRILEALNPEIGPRLGTEARRRVLDGWTWDDQADRYLEYFHSLCGTRSPELIAQFVS